MKQLPATGTAAWVGAGPFAVWLGVLAAILLLGGAVHAQQPSALTGGELPAKAVRQIRTLLAAKTQRTPAQRKVSSQLLDARLTQRRKLAAVGSAHLPATDADAKDERVKVDIRADVTPAVLKRIEDLGGAVINSVERYRAIRARLPLQAVETLAELEAVKSIRTADKAVTRAQTQGLESHIRRDVLGGGGIRAIVDTSEGDVAHQANLARTTHGVDGTGIGIGVISDGVETLADQQATGDGPARVTILPGQEGGSFPLACGGRSSGTEGTAMLEIVHDLAPGAELFFADGGGGRAQMAQNIEDLCAAGDDVIVDDIGYLRASAFQDDVISQAVSAAVANGCYYFSAAGNGGNLNDGTAGVWEGDYAAGSTLSVNGVVVGVAHDFGGGAIQNRITRSSTRPIVLQWADPVDGSANDYDLFLIDADDNVLASSTNTQDGTQDPIEFIGSSCSDELEDNRLVIVKTTGAADRYLRLNYARGGLEIATAGNTFGHSASQDAVGVAAVDVSTAGGAGGVFNGTESVETFSSDGPRRIFFEADGTPITAGNFSSTGGKLLQKPDLAAADGVSTSAPGFSTFHGTSAAAPHAAAIAALMLEAAGGPANVMPAALRTAMTGAALDIEATGVDQDSGAGIVMAPSAVDAVDVALADRNGAPTVSGTLADQTLAPGGAAVTFDVADAFSDPDNNTLTYTALSSDPDRVEVSLTGSMLTLTPKLPSLVMVLVRAVDSHGLSVTLTVLVTVAVGTRDYDVDNDGLIEVGNLAQLDAVRYDLNGDGMVDIASDWQSYYAAAAFVDGALDMGCPSGCTGYELTQNLDFDTNGNGGADIGDDYWNGGDGWIPIGGDGTTTDGTTLRLQNPFHAIFEGNGHTIGNLFIETDTIVVVGLFGYASSFSTIWNLGLIDVDATGSELVAGLVGLNNGEIRGSYVTGRISGIENVGGLVGINSFFGEISGSYSTSQVSGDDDDVGGLVGDNRGKITAAYATGRVSGKTDVGGLVGNNKSTGEITAGYATGPVSGDSDFSGLVGRDEGGDITASYWDRTTSGLSFGSVGEAKSTAQLQAPGGYAGIYQSWNLDLDGNDDPWDFGTSSQYPVLSLDTNGTGGATWQEFGYQGRSGPTLTATSSLPAEPPQVMLSWIGVSASHWNPAPDVTYTVTRDDGSAVEVLVEQLDRLNYTDTDVNKGHFYTYQVAAVVAAGEATRSAPVSVLVAGGNPLPLVTIAPKDNRTSVTEGTAVQFTLTREPPTAAEMTVKVNVTERGEVIETAGSYQPPDEVTFNVGDTTATLTVLTEDDEQQESGGAVIATLQPGAGYRLGGASTQSAQVTVEDNEGGGPPGPIGPGGGLPPVPNPVPSAPRNLQAVGGDRQVTLSWEAPEDDGGFAIADYQYLISGTGGGWISTESTDLTHTVTELTNSRVYLFQVRAVSAAGAGASSHQVEVTPGAGRLEFAHFANGASITSDLVLVNVAHHPIRPSLYFYDREGERIAVESVVELTEELEVTEDGSLTVQTEMQPLQALTISTHGQGEVVAGSVTVLSNGPIGGVLRFDLPGVGVAGVGAGQPLRDALFPARRQAGAISTAAAIRNLQEEELVVTCQLMQEGAVLEEVDIELQANGQDGRFIEEVFTTTDTTNFVGMVRCTAPAGKLFVGVAVELDAGQGIFTTLPVLPVDRTVFRGGEYALDFAHFANGASITSDLVLVNVSIRPSRPAGPFTTPIPPTRPSFYFYDREGERLAAQSVVEIAEDLEITEDGGLTVQSELEPLQAVTISTHGQGEVVAGSVRVVAEGPLGGVLRFDLPGVGVAGVGTGQPLTDALFPARRQEGGISTAAAIRNLEAEELVVSCRLMQEGEVLEEVDIELEANGQDGRFIEEVFTRTDTSDFVGLVRCTAEGEFTGVAVELDAGAGIFTTLPVVPVQR